jgi:hypothetical protein
MADNFWSRIPANAIDPWTSATIRSLMGAQYGRPAGQVGLEGDAVASAEGLSSRGSGGANDGGSPFAPIQIADAGAYGADSRRWNVTPAPGIFDEWKRNAIKSLAPLFEASPQNPAPSMYFPVDICLDKCAQGRPEGMAEFCRAYTIPDSSNARRCWQGVEDLRRGNSDACEGRCRAMQHNWGK